MRVICIAVIVTALVSAIGCSPKKAPEPPAPQAGGVIPQAQLDALNKAKAVEGVVEQGAQREREQADQ